jgi:hypothetical protein
VVKKNKDEAGKLTAVMHNCNDTLYSLIIEPVKVRDRDI